MTLRKIIEADLPLFLTWRNAPDVRNNMYSTQEISEAEHRAWFTRMEHDPQAKWYLHCDENGKPDGVVYFTQYRPDNRSSFWGFYAAPDAPAGTGIKLGLDALDEAFNVLDLHKLNAEVLITNKRSLRFHKKLGFCVEGIFRDHHLDNKKFIDVNRLGILKSEWAKMRPKVKSHITSLNDIKESAKMGGYIES